MNKSKKAIERNKESKREKLSQAIFPPMVEIFPGFPTDFVALLLRLDTHL